MPATATSFKEVDSGGLLTTRQALVDAAGNVAPSISPETTVATYSWVTGDNPAATGVMVRIKGPTTDKVLHIKSIRIAGFNASPGSAIIAVSRASNAGTPDMASVITPITPGQRVSTDSAPTTVVDFISVTPFTVDPALVSGISDGLVFFNTETVGPSGEFYREYGTFGDESLTLVTDEYLSIVCVNGSPDTAVVEIVGQEV